jgi:hypothetical protein
MMIRNASDKVTLDDIRGLASRLSIAIPEQVRTFYLAQNGGIPTLPCWMMENGEWHCIQSFLPMKYGKRTLESVYLMGVEKGYLAKNMVPFANDAGGNYFCFDHRGQVYFYAMDGWRGDVSLDENRKKAAQWLTGSFRAFIAGLVADPEADA